MCSRILCPRVIAKELTDVQVGRVKSAAGFIGRKDALDIGSRCQVTRCSRQESDISFAQKRMNMQRLECLKW